MIGRDKTRINALCLVLGVLLGLAPHLAWSACGANDRTYKCQGVNCTGGTGNWDQKRRWDPRDIPDDTTENAIVVAQIQDLISDLTTSISCLDIQSGQMDVSNGTTLTIVGDYFRNPTAGGLNVGVGSTWEVTMGGSAAQSFENTDPVNHINITNTAAAVTFTDGFTVREELNLSAGATVYIDGDLTLESGSTLFNIPVGTTVELRNGATLYAYEGVTVAGSLIFNSGSGLVVGNSKSLTIQSGGTLQLWGSSGNIVAFDSDGVGNSFTFTMNGTMSADYFKISRMGALGLNIGSGATVSILDNGEFHNIAASGFALTLNASANIPSILESLGFFNDDSNANARSIDATSYSGSSITINDWGGDVGGESFDSDPNCGGDPPGCISWGGQASTSLAIANNSDSSAPPSSIGQGSSNTNFGTFAFSLTQADTATDITEIILTQTGTATSSDIGSVKVFQDNGAGTSCVYDVGVDTQIGTDVSLSGSPLTGTLSIPAGMVRTSSTTPACIHIIASTSETASSGKTIQFSLKETPHVSNEKVTSGSYSLSQTSGPPVTLGASTISGSSAHIWTGGVNRRWDGEKSGIYNWSTNSVPTSADDCQVGAGSRTVRFNVAGSCRNTILESTGTIDWVGSSRELSVYGALTVQGGFTYIDATAGPAVIGLRGSTAQSVQIQEPFPGNVIVDNSGGSIINVDANSTIQGDLTVTNGVLTINSGITLKVYGNVSVGASATLDIKPGGTLDLGDNVTLSTLTVDGSLLMTGASGSLATVTSSLGSTTSYRVVVNGSVSAQYYTFNKIDSAGVTISSGAIIDSTNHLQNGNFTGAIKNSTTYLSLQTQVPTNTMDGCVFDGSTSLTGMINIDTTGANSGTLTLDNYSGRWSGESYDNEVNYDISWTTPTNTLTLVRNAAIADSSLTAGSTYNMGRFAFSQTDAGSFNDTDITSLVLELTGTSSASDIDEVRTFYDSNCDGVGGTQIGGAKTFSGNPATATFSYSASQATIDSHASSPPDRCIYVEFDISVSATDGATAGVRITSSTKVVNDQGYAFSGTTSFPVTLGGPTSIVSSGITTWTGSVNQDWTNASNWSFGVPDASKTCQINFAANSPVISSGTQSCDSVEIGNGTLTINGGNLEVYGSLTNTGTLSVSSGNLIIRDDGLEDSAQTISSTSTLASLTFNKTAGGTVAIAGSGLTVTYLTFPASQNFQFEVTSGKTLTLPNGTSIPAGVTFEIDGGGTVEIGSGQTLSVSGGDFRINGTNDAYPQNTSNKGVLTGVGGARWSFLASSGTVNLRGFLINYLNVSGLQISGTTSLTQMDGGQFSYLSADFSTPMRAISLSTSMAVTDTTPTNVGFNWDVPNTVGSSSCCAPDFETDSFYLVYASNCGSATLVFNQWFGDFINGTAVDDNESKINDSDDGGFSCQISMAASASPVSLLSFQAHPYDSEIQLSWKTGLEQNHLGFNLYRSENPKTGFLQINKELIRNQFTSATIHGEYHFRDQSIQNGTLYYYLLEDVASNGLKSRHGPVHGKGETSLGPAPTPISGNVNGSDGLDLGNGVRILAQTSNSLRLEIVPSQLSLNPATWNSAYHQVSIPGYSRTLTVGHPELLERTLLIEVEKSFTSVRSDFIMETEDDLGTFLLSPSPDWKLADNGVLQPDYQPNAQAYALTIKTPSEALAIQPQSIEINGRHYLEVKVSPLKYLPTSGELYKLSRLVVDIGMGGDAWVPPSEFQSNETPASAADGNLRIRYAKNGLYQIAYDDLYQTYTEGPFENQKISELRLYYKDQEIPLEIDSADDIFNSGDFLRFYAPYERSYEDAFEAVYLSSYSQDELALRMKDWSASPIGGTPTPSQGSYIVKEYEENHFAPFDVPMGELVDRIYWQRIAAPKGADPLPNGAYFTTTVDLPHIHIGSVRPFFMDVYVRGRGALSDDPIHTLGIFVNGYPDPVATAQFQSQLADTVVSFEVDQSYFMKGENQIQIAVLGTHVPQGDWDIVDINRFEISYVSEFDANGDNYELFNTEVDRVVTLNSWKQNQVPKVYDITQETDPVRLIGVDLEGSFDGGLSYVASFNTPSGPLGERGQRLIALQDSGYLAPEDLSLVSAESAFLKKNSEGADLIILGPKHLLRAAKNLSEHRRDQGLRVAEVPTEQIYAEFSNGRTSSKAIRDFLHFARLQWPKPSPQYVFMIGDGTYDPQGQLGYDRSAFIPTPILLGQHMDYGSDHWFVEELNHHRPVMAVGRLPVSEEAEVDIYVKKLIAYENGEKGPSEKQAKHGVFLSGTDHFGQDFNRNILALKDSFASSHGQALTSVVSRKNLTSDKEFQSQILNKFDEGPFVMTYLGHGAEDRWHSAEALTNQVASELKNQRLPIVIALNCLNAHYYNVDPSFKSLGETLVTNPEGGGIAFWGSTSMTSPIAQEHLATHMFNELGSSINGSQESVRLGDLFLRAKVAMGDEPFALEALKSWTLLGDPSLKLPQNSFNSENAAPPSAETAPSTNNKRESEPTGGGSGCGFIGPNRRPPGSPPASLLFLLLLPMAFVSHLRKLSKTS